MSRESIDVLAGVHWVKQTGGGGKIVGKTIYGVFEETCGYESNLEATFEDKSDAVAAAQALRKGSSSVYEVREVRFYWRAG